MMTRVYDTLIAGGGPAGLSAAIYMGRFLRSTIVVDSGAGRSSGPQANDNYLGFPRGVRVQRLRELGRRQAERFGVEFAQSTLLHASRHSDGFRIEGERRTWQARSVILATGVTDVWPSVPNVGGYIGRSLFWCITCDGFRTRGKNVVLIGASGEAATTACQFLRYTDRLTFVAVTAADGSCTGGSELDTLRNSGITVVEGGVERFVGARGRVRAVHAGGRRLPADIVFSLLGAAPNTGLAAQLGVMLDPAGYIRIDREQRTNVPGVYAAGDVTGPFAHQIASAVHEGSMAAQSANYDLYDEFQRD